MLDKNVVILEGVAGDDVKYGTSTNGKEYCTFTLLINTFSKDLGDEDEHTRSLNMIRILVFNNAHGKLVDYLKRVGFRRGHRVNIFGRLSSYKNEYKGIDIIQNNVVVRDITVVTTKSKQPKEEENGRLQTGNS